MITRAGTLMAKGEWSDAGPVRTASLGRVLLLTASVGGGHTRAAEAVAAAIRERARQGLLRYERVEVVDTLAVASSWFRGAYRGAYLGLLSKAPSLVGWLYDRSDRPFRGVRSRWAAAHAGLGGLRALLRDLRPDTIVSTHFLPSEYLAGLRLRGDLRSRLTTVVTDVHVHGMWLADPCDRYFVASSDGAATLETHGVPGDRISVTGIPIDPIFSLPLDRRTARERHGIEGTRPVILFTTGGACVGPVERIYRSLLSLRTPCEVLVVTGKSAEARERLALIAARHPAGSAVRTRVIGHTTVMHELRAAADLLVGKPGGLTSAECRAVGLPMAIVHTIPGQEEHNARALLKAGCAIRCDSVASVVSEVELLLSNPAALVRMAQQAKAGSHPHAADRIAEAIGDAARTELAARV
jgi:processive 1,2-diacylglycerol beta-glucosyltransferase